MATETTTILDLYQSMMALKSDIESIIGQECDVQLSVKDDGFWIYMATQDIRTKTVISHLDIEQFKNPDIFLNLMVDEMTRKIQSAKKKAPSQESKGL